MIRAAPPRRRTPLGAWLVLAACTGGAGQPARPASDERAPDPDAGLIPVLATAQCDDTPAEAPFCERIGDLAGWRQLQQRLQPCAERLPGDWCGFATGVVLAVGTGRGSAAPGFAVDVATEEGVDVIVLTQRLGDAGTARRSPAVLLALPRRRHALAVVLRRARGDTPVDETTLGVFEPAR